MRPECPSQSPDSESCSQRTNTIPSMTRWREAERSVTALSLNRYAIASERSRYYLEGQAIRCKAEGLEIMRYEVAA